MLRRTGASWSVAVFLYVAGVVPSWAQPEALICFGNEPFWSVDLSAGESATFSRPGVEPVVYRGAGRAGSARGERLWRGRPGEGSGDLVVFIMPGPCSDGMSDTAHPATARVSTPDGGFLMGCCRRVHTPGPSSGAASPLAGPTWRLFSATGHQASVIAALKRPVTMRFRTSEVSGSFGCNGFGGTYTLEGDRIAFGPLMGTMMACPQPVMSIENAVRKALTGSVPYTVAGDTLTLNASGGVTLVFKAVR